MAQYGKQILGAFALCVAGLALTACGGSSSNSQAVSTSSPVIFYAHSVAFRNSTTLSWGYNGNGQLGIGTADTHSTPAIVSGGGGYPSGLVGVTDFAVGGTHTLAFNNLSGASMVAWGNNGNGQLGDGDTKVQSAPVTVLRATGTPLISVKAVAAGGLHSLALRRDGTVWGWGYNGLGQLGNNTTAGTAYATLVAGPGTPGSSTDPITPLTSIAAGGSHSLACDGSGRVWAWGYNGYGQLGNGDTTDKFVPFYILDRIPVVSGRKIIAVAAGGSTSLALDDGGNIYGWGYNAFGQAGSTPPADPAAPQYVNTPQLITGTTALPFFTKIAVGLDHCLALDASGNVWSWGYNGYGQLGIADYVVPSVPEPTPHPTPQQVAGLPQIKDIRAIGHYSVAVDTAGKVWTWGYNAFSQLGDGTTTSRSQPRLVSGY